MLAVLVAALIGVGGWAIFRGSAANRAGKVALEEGQTRNFYCENCMSVTRLSFRKLPPQICPKCNQDKLFRADLVRCKACDKTFPLLLHRWSGDEKARGEKLLAEKEFLSSAEVDSLMRSKTSKTSTRDWMPYADAYNQRRDFRCPHCGNTNPSQLDEFDPPSL